MTVNPHRPETTRQAANDTAADAITPNATSAGTPEPVGMSHELRDEPHESTGSYPGSTGENDDSRGPGAHCMRVTAQRPQAATGEASADATNPNVTSVGTPEPVGAAREPPDEPADGRAVHMRSPLPVHPGVYRSRGSERARDSGDERHAWVQMHRARAPQTTDQGSDGISLAVPASSLNGHEVEMSTDETTNTTANAHTPGKPPSMLLKGECNAQKCMNGTCTGRQHDATAHAKDVVHGQNSTTAAQQATALEETASREVVEEAARIAQQAAPATTRNKSKWNRQPKSKHINTSATHATDETPEATHRAHQPTMPTWTTQSPIGLVIGCIGYGPAMLGEHPRATGTQAEGWRARYTKTVCPHRQNMSDAPRITKRVITRARCSTVSTSIPFEGEWHSKQHTRTPNVPETAH
ncbi:hypothetical protein BU15DRAFT_68910 [Melanogaster broomeanus]|nr:hypothetical protein BU15DRAFT_68910 [Melanogaster broomeanus]